VSAYRVYKYTHSLELFAHGILPFQTGHIKILINTQVDWSENGMCAFIAVDGICPDDIHVTACRHECVTNVAKCLDSLGQYGEADVALDQDQVQVKSFLFLT
jgi:hypothetical protein